MPDRSADVRLADTRARPPERHADRARPAIVTHARAGARLACLALAMASGTAAGFARAADEPDRGEALYANQCGECHGAAIHRRETPRVRSREELYGWVAAWSVHAGTSWSEEEIESVTSYLSREAYRFTR